MVRGVTIRASDVTSKLPLVSVVVNWITPTRRLLAGVGVTLLLVLGFIQEGSGSERIALIALSVLIVASALACAEIVGGRRADKERGGLSIAIPTDARAWIVTALLVTTGAILAVQTWFGADASIAAGDIAPPDGVAWLGRLFAPWVWSGSDLGSPGVLEPQLPWAVISGLVHFAGGNGQLAQRVWYSALFSGSALSALFLLKTLGSRPLAAAIGAAVYVFNPYVLTLNVNPVYILTLALAALLPTCVLASGRSQISIRTAAVLIGICAPLLGYAYESPPLVGMLLALTIASPLLAWWLWGTTALWRASRAMILGLALLLLASSFWIIPAVIQLKVSAIGNLAAVSSWSWTEVRATLSNAFWLNTTWAWNAQYFPFAPSYSGPPLSFLKFVLPASAFGALIVAARRAPGPNSNSALGLPIVAAASIVALFVLVLSTGTRPPGNAIFGPLYGLPFGWLLREPGRFLLLAGLAYAILVGALVERLSSATLSGSWSARFHKPQFGPAVAVVLGGAISLGLGFPLAVGSVVPDARPPLPSTHVRLPGYWVDMAAYIDRAPYDGSVLILPPDDFYQMPYRWGYYGTDGFIPTLMTRPVLVPNPQGYFQASTTLLEAVDLLASSLLTGDWEEADRLLQSVGTPLILVRGDINSDLPGRAILAPATISGALETAPNFKLIHRAGPLALFARLSPIQPTLVIAPAFATVDSTSPDLRALSILPAGTDFVSAPAIPGVIRFSQVAPLSSWDIAGGALNDTLAEPVGWQYKIGLINSGKPPIVVDPIAATLALSPFVAVAKPEQPGAQGALTVQLPLGKSLITDGAFQVGAWQPSVGDCNDVKSVAAPALDARLIGGGPNGLPALRLSASAHSACEARGVSWHGGPMLVHLWIRHVSGAAPRLCMFEFGPDRCAPFSSEFRGTGWAAYTVNVEPEAGTKGVELFVYADADPSGARTVNDYADVAVYSVPSTDLVLIGYPNVPKSESSTQLLVLRESYSDNWKGPAHSKHVLVDGMTNGWLIAQTGSVLTAVYGPATLVSLGTWVSLGASIVILLLALTRLQQFSARVRRHIHD